MTVLITLSSPKAVYAIILFKGTGSPSAAAALPLAGAFPLPLALPLPPLADWSSKVNRSLASWTLMSVWEVRRRGGWEVDEGRDQGCHLIFEGLFSSVWGVDEITVHRHFVRNNKHFVHYITPWNMPKPSWNMSKPSKTKWVKHKLPHPHSPTSLTQVEALFRLFGLGSLWRTFQVCWRHRRPIAHGLKRTPRREGKSILQSTVFLSSPTPFSDFPSNFFFF